MFNSLGNILKLTTFGESHGLGIGGVIDGFPAGVEVDLEAVQKELDRRKPGQSKIVTQRKEPDTVELLRMIRNMEFVIIVEEEEVLHVKLLIG